jgi:DNA-directed RNA polymerase subunit omega
MHEELKEEAIVNKVGGRFKLSTLIQKRLVQLNQDSRPLVTLSAAERQNPQQDKMKIVLQEILQDKIYLDASNELRIMGDLPISQESPDFGD